MHSNNINAGAMPRPQNSSYPAGGTSDARTQRRGQRGVLVAPPSGNTDHPASYQVLHRGFDTLTIAIKAHIPKEVLDYLETQKEVAEREAKDVLIEWNGVQLHLKGHGGKGYSFIANGGPMGAQWAFTKPNAKNPWGIRVTLGSTFMATLGLGAAKAHLEDVLERFGIRTRSEDFSMSRVDYCVDILAPTDFKLDPELFVMHSSTNRRDHVANADMRVQGKSGRVTSVTIGSPRARQVIVYDKRAEVIQQHKPHWWFIWNQTRKEQGLPLIGPDTPDLRVWRVEIRAGKDLLKDRWDIRTWEDLFARFGDMSAETGQVVRYTDPAPSDSNRARWPNHLIWEIALGEINTDLIEMAEGSDPNPIKEVQREHHISTLLKNIKGSTITLAALEGVEMGDLQRFIGDTADLLKREVQTNPEHTSKQLREAQDRYVFITPANTNAPPERQEN